MKFLKPLGIGLVILLVGQGLAVALSFLEGLSGLFGYYSEGNGSLALAGLSYYLALAVTGILAGLPDRGRAAALAIALILLGLIVPTLIKDGLRLREVSRMTEAIDPSGPLPQLPTTIALVRRGAYGSSPSDLACDWQCRELLASGAVTKVVMSVGSDEIAFDHAEKQVAWRFEPSPSCRQSVKDARLFRRFEIRQELDAILPPVENMSDNRSSAPDPLDGCFVQTGGGIRDARAALVDTMGTGPAPGSPDRPAYERSREIMLRTATGWEAIGRSGTVTFALEGYPYWPTPSSPLMARPLGDRLKRREYGSVTVLTDYADSLIRAALASAAQ